MRPAWTSVKRRARLADNDARDWWRIPHLPHPVWLTLLDDVIWIVLPTTCATRSRLSEAKIVVGRQGPRIVFNKWAVDDNAERVAPACAAASTEDG